MNIYKITYFEYDPDENMYYESFSYTVNSDKTEEEIFELTDNWNNELKKRNINGTILCVPISITPIEDLSIEDFILDIQDL